ncbi:MAG: electron transfer flavoprotein subunit beta/FixA family protein [Planctomycetota bacterium]|nr:MAG: electron transfer flavoprotein subunit beta/FixA family protein [Planctomycetota bacterium]
MDVIVCVKRVPSTTTRVVIGGDRKSIDPTGVEFLLNPYDEFAVEEALKQRDAAGGGTVTAVSFGTAEAQKELRTVLAMGADAALLLQSAQAPLCDGATTARALADAIRGRKFDLLFFGKQAVDMDQHGVGPAVATLLGVPCISEVVHLEVKDGKVTAHREVEGAHEIVEAPLPCAVTAQKGLNEPRYATLKGIMAAKKKPLDVVDASVGEPLVEIVEMKMPPPRAAGKMVGEGPEAVPALVQLLKHEAKVL